MKNITYLVFLLIIASSCKRDGKGSYSGLSAVLVNGDLTYCSNIVYNPQDGNFLVDATNYYAEPITRLLLLDPVAKKIIGSDSIHNSITGGSCSNGSYYYVVNSLQGPSQQDTPFLFITRYDRNLNKVNKVLISELFAVNYFQAAIKPVGNGLLCITSSTPSHDYLSYYLFDQDLNLIKKDTSGNPGMKFNRPSIKTFQVLKDGSYLLAISDLDTAFNFSLYIQKLDVNLKPVWTKAIQEDGHIYPSSFVIEESGAFWITGNFLPNSSTTTDFDPIVYKLDASGSLTNRYYKPTPWNDWRGASAVPTQDGGIIFASSNNSGKGANYIAMLTKLDKSGNEVWQKSYGGPKNIAQWPIIRHLGDNSHVLMYFDNSFFNSAQGYNLVMEYLNDNGEITGAPTNAIAR